MSNILITGATGNIGKEIIAQPLLFKQEHKIIAGVRDITKAKNEFSSFHKLEYVKFDFEEPASFDTAFSNIDIVFLLRPPHISDIKRYFYPLFVRMKTNGISKIVFLSVQGADKSRVIPHNQIETMIKHFDFDSIILRPGYFMQNLTTTLLSDIKDNRIVLPSGKAQFNWIDIVDIAEVAVKMLTDFDKHKGEIFELTGSENLSFHEVTEKINFLLNLNILYKSVNPFRYFNIKKAEGIPKDKIIVMMLLHFLPIFQRAPEISMNVKQLTGHPPSTLNDFILRNRDYFIS